MVAALGFTDMLASQFQVAWPYGDISELEMVNILAIFSLQSLCKLICHYNRFNASILIKLLRDI